MMNFLWPSERSTYHKTCVRRINKYLKQKCSKGGSEKGLVAGYRTDAFGYDGKSKTWYLCEIKVDPSDLKKGPQQILDTKYHFPKTKYYHIGDTIVPVIAIPAKLANHLVKVNEWKSLKNTCKMLNISIWVIEQSTVREVTKPKPKSNRKTSAVSKAVKTKVVSAKTTTKNKPAQTKKPKSKVGALKTTKSKKTSASTKRKSAASKATKSKRAKPKLKK